MDESKRTSVVSFGLVKIDGEKAAGTEEYCKEKPVPERNYRLESPTKSKWHVFMFGFGTGKFPTTMELSDIKSRQLRQQQTTNTLSDGGEDDEIDRRRRSGKKRWWLLLDVFRCGGGYEGHAAVKDLQASFQTLKKFD